MPRLPRIVATVFLVALPALAAKPAAAAWPHDPATNVAVCTAPNSQIIPQNTPDGSGGVIVVWQEARGADYDIYAQRISAAGVPLWATNGIPVCVVLGDQGFPTVASDGAGGAIITWQDVRASSYCIYAQRINAAGTPQWTVNGVAVCIAPNGQASPVLVSDGAGGAIIAWQDGRSGLGSDVYAQRMNSAGTPQWTANGVALCTATGNQSGLCITTDGSGGATLGWQDLRNGNNDIFAQRVNAAGVTQWLANGVVLCTAASDQTNPVITADGSGGAIVAWADARSGNSDIYAQRVNATGQALWTSAGVALCTAINNQTVPSITSDAASGAIVAWQDGRGNSNDVYVQRLNAAGTPVWTANGVAVCTAALDQLAPVVASDGSGGAIVGWMDIRSGTTQDIFSQRINPSGAIQWTTDGVAVCTANSAQQSPLIVPDVTGGAILTWSDSRNGNSDFYCQRIEHYGSLGNPEPAIAKVKDVPNDQGGSVKVSWDASYLDADPVFGITEYRVFRSAPGSLASAAGASRTITEDSDIAVRNGALLTRTLAGATVYWEYVGTQAAQGFAGYSQVVATTGDSVASSNPRTLFMIEARAGSSLSTPRWDSAPDSGYSVDNLAPAAPAPLTGQYSAGVTRLHWNRNVEADLAGYHLYRGSSPAFVPSAGNLVSTLADTGYVDAAAAPYIYKLTAVDSHGNESPVATLLPTGTLGVGDGAALTLAFAAPSPNPARGSTTLEFTLPQSGHVRLSLFDAAGRRVQTLRDGEMAAGAHRQAYTLRDDAGRDLAAGLYLVRLETAGRVITRRLAAVR